MRLWLASVDKKTELRKYSRIAQPQPMAVGAGRGHVAVGGRHRKGAVLLEDGALGRQQVRQVVRAWTGEAGDGCGAASKLGRDPVKQTAPRPRARSSTPTTPPSPPPPSTPTPS